MTQRTYDNLDRITQILDANSGVSSFSYDGNGNLLSLTNANHNQTTYSYDKLNRRSSRIDALSKATATFTTPTVISPSTLTATATSRSISTTGSTVGRSPATVRVATSIRIPSATLGTGAAA